MKKCKIVSNFLIFYRSLRYTNLLYCIILFLKFSYILTISMTNNFFFFLTNYDTSNKLIIYTLNFHIKQLYHKIQIVYNNLLNLNNRSNFYIILLYIVQFQFKLETIILFLTSLINE